MSSIRLPVLALALAAFLGTRPASAETPAPDVVVIEIPRACEVFAQKEQRDWSKLLSLAACMQDASVGVIVDRALLPGMVEELAHALGPAMMIYADALLYGPPPIQLRAAYQVGSTYVALMTRSRASIVAPYDKLHADLEPLLARFTNTAWIAFTTIDRAAAFDPSLASDPVARYMIASARAMLAWLHPVHSPEQLLDAARRASPAR